jgi:hypothetical protein
MNAKDKRYWFGAKRYGSGWGPPITWEGWLVLVLWIAALFLGRRYLVPNNIYAHLVFALAMVGLLWSICYSKGEPPRWRFGERD